MKNVSSRANKSTIGVMSMCGLLEGALILGMVVCFKLMTDKKNVHRVLSTPGNYLAWAANDCTRLKPDSSILNVKLSIWVE